MAWWTGVIVIIIFMAVDSLRYKLGIKRGIIALGLVVLFNILGVYMFVYSWYETPQCIPARIYTSLLIFYGGTCVGIVTMIIIYFYIGRQSIASFFVDEVINKKVIAGIQAGEIEVKAYLESEAKVDTYTLFESERLLIHEECAVVNLNTHQAKPLCGLCGEELKSEIKMSAFPVCTHVYHVECLDSWFEKSVACPYCNVGARSGLYKILAAKNKALKGREAKSVTEDKKTK